MSDYKIMAETLKNLLGMKNEAVAIKLLDNNDSAPDYDQTNKYTFCQFIMKAREGHKLLATGDNIACANGASALGFTPVPEKIRSGEFMAQLGSFQQAGAQQTMAVMPRFSLGQYTGIALAPLSEVDFEPDLIVLETVPEQLMWLSLAVIHQQGGRLQFSTNVSNGACVDITVVPQQTQALNVSLGCYGCRNATSIPAEHLLAGFPAKLLPEIIASLQSLSDKVIPRSREKKAYARVKSSADK